MNPYKIFISFWVPLSKKDLDLLRTRNYSKRKQYTISVLLIVATSVLCFFFVPLIGYGAVALILLMAVSLNAILFDIFPVMVSALLSALIWNFFFIPPTLTFHIETPEDGLMFLMYFVSPPSMPCLPLRSGSSRKGNGTKKKGKRPLCSTIRC